MRARWIDFDSEDEGAAEREKDTSRVSVALASFENVLLATDDWVSIGDTVLPLCEIVRLREDTFVVDSVSSFDRVSVIESLTEAELLIDCSSDSSCESEMFLERDNVGLGIRVNVLVRSELWDSESCTVKLNEPFVTRRVCDLPLEFDCESSCEGLEERDGVCSDEADG